MLRIRDIKDAGAGLMFAAFGVFAVTVAAMHFPIGSAFRMGPGFFPLIVGAVLILFGAILMGRSVVTEGSRIPRFRIRPLVGVLFAILAFAATIESYGIIVAACALVVLCRAGGWDFSWRESLVLGVVLAALSVGIFVFGLSMPFRLWPM